MDQEVTSHLNISKKIKDQIEAEVGDLNLQAEKREGKETQKMIKIEVAI